MRTLALLSLLCVPAAIQAMPGSSAARVVEGQLAAQRLRPISRTTGISTSSHSSSGRVYYHPNAARDTDNGWDWAYLILACLVLLGAVFRLIAGIFGFFAWLVRLGCDDGVDAATPGDQPDDKDASEMPRDKCPTLQHWQ